MSKPLLLLYKTADPTATPCLVDNFGIALRDLRFWREIPPETVEVSGGVFISQLLSFVCF